MGDGDRRSRPFEAGSRGTLGRRFQAEKGGAQGGGTGRYKGEKVKGKTRNFVHDGIILADFGSALMQNPDPPSLTISVIIFR